MGLNGQPGACASNREGAAFPPRLPDLFHGGQLVILGRSQGAGDAPVKLTGTLGKEQYEFIYPAYSPAVAR